MRERRVTVLCAEDHPIYRAGLVRGLRTDPRLEVVGEAEDGRAAFGAALELRPDVAVIDMSMPQMSGAEVVEALAREQVPVRVLLLTGDVTSPEVYRALEQGAAGVLSKLVDSGALAEAILAVARGEVVIAPEAQGALLSTLRGRAQDERPLLTPRESEVLRHVAEGMTVPAIAGLLYLAPSTIKTHLDHIYRKLGVADRAAAVAEAMRRGLLR